jgi:hypothetical protein
MTETLAQKLNRVSEEIYERTKRNPANWVQHTHGPNDRADSCNTCKMLGLTQADWDDALREE